jgi:uncharacterized protein (TIGR02588 family)
MAKRSQNGFKPQSSSPAEWVVAALGAAIVIVTVGYLLYFEFAGGPPHATISIIEHTVQYTTDSEYLVRFRIRNSGRATAAHVHVQGKLLQGDKTFESSDVTFDYVPGFSSRTGTLFFTHDPAKVQLQLRPVSFTEP